MLDVIDQSIASELLGGDPFELPVLGAECQRRREAVWRFVGAAVHGDRQGYIASLDALDWPEAWPDVFREVVAIGWVPLITQRTFAKMWQAKLGQFVTYPPGGCRLRLIFCDELDLFIDGLRILLPPYEDQSHQVIYRGQSVCEYESGVLGLSWSPYPMLAEKYACDSALNTVPCLVLASFFPSNAIIGCINESEVVVDSRRITNTHVLYKPEGKQRSMKVEDCATLMFHNLIPAKARPNSVAE